MQARRGELVDVLEGEGRVATLEGRRLGLITWVRADRDAASAGAGEADDPIAAEIRALAVSGDARGRGIGRALLLAAEQRLRDAGARRAWLVTTNDNLPALALYQKAGWHLAELRAGAVAELRRTIKPSIPEIGEHGIPIRDELELSKRL